MSIKKSSRKTPSNRQEYRKSPEGKSHPRRSVSPPSAQDISALRAQNPLFANLGVRAECLGLLKEQAITEPTPIQSDAIPPVLEGRDLVAVAQTGTGKTLAFALPVLAQLAEAGSKNATALILSPTRELAQQIYDVIHPLARALRLRATCIYGGVSMDHQVRDLKSGGGVVIATPGRLLDHIHRGNTRFENLITLVLDEADRMLDMGFIPDIRRILTAIPEQRQTLMFSATFPQEIARLTHGMMENPLRLEVDRSATPAASLRQSIYTVEHTSKQNLLTRLLEDDTVRSAIIFVRTKRRADRVTRSLAKSGFQANALHGDRTQGQRKRAIAAFAGGTCRYLVATDVAARGIDVSDVSHVINYDMPGSSDDYVHRIGRTARAHADGDAITFVSAPDALALSDIEKAIGQTLDHVEWEGSIVLPAKPSVAPKRKKQGTGRPRQRPGNARKRSAVSGKPRDRQRQRKAS